MVVLTLDQCPHVPMWHRHSGPFDFSYLLGQRSHEPWPARPEDRVLGLLKGPVVFPGPWALERGLDAAQL